MIAGQRRGTTHVVHIGYVSTDRAHPYTVRAGDFVSRRLQFLHAPRQQHQIDAPGSKGLRDAFFLHLCSHPKRAPSDLVG